MIVASVNWNASLANEHAAAHAFLWIVLFPLPEPTVQADSRKSYHSTCTSTFTSTFTITSEICKSLKDRETGGVEIDGAKRGRAVLRLLSERKANWSSSPRHINVEGQECPSARPAGSGISGRNKWPWAVRLAIAFIKLQKKGRSKISLAVLRGCIERLEAEWSRFRAIHARICYLIPVAERTTKSYFGSAVRWTAESLWWHTWLEGGATADRTKVKRQPLQGTSSVKLLS